jgi:hypothetical protein
MEEGRYEWLRDEEEAAGPPAAAAAEGRYEWLRDKEAAASASAAAASASAAAAAAAADQGGGGAAVAVAVVGSNPTSGAGRRAGARSFQEAVQLLEGSRQNPLWSLVLVERDAANGDGDDDDDDGARLFFFRRFVALLEQQHEEEEEEEGNGARVGCLHFGRVSWATLPDDASERLFGVVLPGHPTLREIDLDGVPLALVKVLVASLPARSPLEGLHWYPHSLDHDSVHALAATIRRNNTLSKLNVHPVVGLRADDAKIICHAVSSNANLRQLGLQVKEVFEDTLDQVVAPSSSSSPSSLRELSVQVIIAVPGAFVGRLARQLRTNTALTRLELCHGSYSTGPPTTVRGQERLFRPLLAALETYNCTLVHVDVCSAPWEDGAHALAEAMEARIAPCTRRNRRIQRALAQLEPRSYHVHPATLGLVLGAVSALPTLVYRIVRRGNVSTLCDLVPRRDNVVRPTMRGRAAEDDMGGGNSNEWHDESCEPPQ